MFLYYAYNMYFLFYARIHIIDPIVIFLHRKSHTILFLLLVMIQYPYQTDVHRFPRLRPILPALKARQASRLPDTRCRREATNAPRHRSTFAPSFSEFPLRYPFVVTYRRLCIIREKMFFSKIGTR